MDDEPICQKCGAYMEWDDCNDCDGEGHTFPYELLPLEYGPDETEICSTCSGNGGWWVCPMECWRR